MKKILALVLALVMTLSLATISSGAAFTDADKIQYVDAVDTLNALGVVNGRTNGSFDPQGDVTRGAAAKMVALVATATNKTIVGYYAGTSSFADVPATHTFADVVAYCVGKGIVDGYGDGTFGVGDNVKGWAVAKMALVAMGYDAEAFGLTGTGAALRTIELATSEGLFAGLKSDFVATEPASREECAQIIYNAMRTLGVKVTETSTAGTVTYGPADATLMSKYVGGVKSGMVVANVATGAAATMVGAVDLTNATGLEMIGHNVWYFVDSSVAEVEGAETAYAIVDRSYEVVVSAAEVEAMDDDAFEAKFGAESIEGAEVVVFENYVADEDVVEDVEIDADSVEAGTYVFDVATGALIAFKAPATFDVTYVDVYTAIDGEEDGVLTLGIDEYDWELPADEAADVSFYADIAEGDVVAVQQTGELFTVTKLDTVSGVVTQMKDDESVTIGGKVYYLGTLLDDADLDFEEGTILADTAWLGEDVTLYLDINGAVVAVVATPGAVVEATTSVVYVVAKYSSAVEDVKNAYGQVVTPGYTNYFVQAVGMDGKEAILQVTEETYTGLVLVDDEETEDVNESEVGLYVATATTDDDGVTTYAFAKAVAVGEDATWVIGSAAGNDATAKKIADNRYFASDVKYIYVSVDEDGDMSKLAVEVKTGAQVVPAAAEYYAVQVGETANYNVKYVVIADAYSEAPVANDDIVFVYENVSSTDKKAYTKADGSKGTAYVQTVYINGELKTVDSVDQNLNAGIYGYVVDEYGYYDFTAITGDDFAAVAVEATVDNLYGTLLTLDEEGFEDFEAKDAKIVDAEYDNMDAADKAEATLIKTLAGLEGADVVAIYDAEASSFVTIYVIARAD